MKLVSLLILILIVISAPLGQVNRHMSTGAYTLEHEKQILKEFVGLLSIPNVASDRANIEKNSKFIMEMMKKRGLNPRSLVAERSPAPPAVYGEWSTPGATQTLVLYAHYDGQPTDPNEWTDSGPWQPVFRSGSIEAGGQLITPLASSEAINPDWRLYARSSSDDKAGVMAILTALDALRFQGKKLTSNLKFLFEGEEEAGSPHLGEIIDQNKTLLNADAWIICDGPIHQSGKKQVVFGVRGDTNVDITVYAANRPLHSGHYGNWAPNPAERLSRLLASMKSNSGRVLIPGWYADVEALGKAERRAIAEAPHYDDELKRQLGLAERPSSKSLLEQINLPSLNINGMSSGDVGMLARNIIPTTATVVLDLRLVKGNDYRRQVDRLRRFIRSQGYYIVDREPTPAERAQYSLIAKVIHRSGGYNAERTRMDLPISLAVVDGVQSTSVGPIVKLPTAGGSLPLSIITAKLRLPYLLQTTTTTNMPKTRTSEFKTFGMASRLMRLS